MAVILIGGGARSGKSRYALERARAIEGSRVFIATAQAADEEMAARIRRHQQERGAEFATIEEPVDLRRVLAETKGDAIVVDCLTLWLSNVMLTKKDCDTEVDALVKAMEAAQGTIFCITNEVGCGIVPTDHALSREFRDRAGTLNQRISAIAREVYLIVFGQALRVK